MSDTERGSRVAQEALAFEREVGNLIAAARWTPEPLTDPALDYLFARPDGKVAIVAKLRVASDGIPALLEVLRRAQALADDVVVVYREGSTTAVGRLSDRAAQAGLHLRAFDRNEFAAWLGVPATTTGYGTALAMALIASEVPAQIAGSLQAGTVWHRLSPPARREAAQATDLEAFLRIGEELRELTFVMSDIEGYSTLVGEARPSDLVKSMARIYRESRNVVLRHGGFLVGFTGDSVLAVFDYPNARTDQHKRAVLCAADLVRVARPLLDELLRTLNNDITTSTRVAITNGDALVVDAGIEAPDPQFVGDALNLAARLQAVASPDGLLIDNRTHYLLEQSDPVFLNDLRATRTSVPSERVKGQATGIVAWAVDPGTLRALASLTSPTVE